MIEPWSADGAAVAHQIGTDPATGLTRTEAAQRLARVGLNRLDPAPPVPAWCKLLAQFLDPLALLLLAAVLDPVVGLVRRLDARTTWSVS